MNFYNLPKLKISKRVLDAASIQRKQSNAQRLQSASIKHNSYYNCCIISDETFYARRIDLDTGKTQEKQVKLSNEKLNGIFLCRQNIILKNISNKIWSIQVDTIFNTSKSSFITFEERDCDYFSSSLTIDNGSSNSVEFIKMEEDLILVHLLESSIAFQSLAGNSKKKWMISAWDLGFGRCDRVIAFSVKYAIFGNGSQRQLIVGVLKIQQQNGDQAYLLLEMLWNQSRYVSSQIYTCHPNLEEQTCQSKILFSMFSSLKIVVYTGKHLIICKRQQEGIQVQGILPIYHQICDIICFQNRYNEEQVLAVCKNKNKTRIYNYNLNQIFFNLKTEPKIIYCDKPLLGEIIGFLKLPTQNPLLVFSDQTYILLPTILTLYQKITTIYETLSTLQEEIEDFQLIQQDVSQTQLQFLSFDSFYKLFNKNGREIEQAISELFSANNMGKRVLQFQESLQRQLKCFINDTSICWNSLERQYASIFIYLLKFLRHIQDQTLQNQPVVALSDLYVLQIQQAFTQFYVQKPLVQERLIESILRKKIIEIKQNLLGFLNLFRKTSKDQIDTQQSAYQYFSILKNLTKTQIIEFVVDTTSLVDYLAFFIYQAALLQNTQQWKMGRSLLGKISGTSKDYPPLIGFLCGDLENYSRCYQELEFCKLLRIKQQREKHELQNLPSLKQTMMAADYHLKKAGYIHLLSFVPDEYERNKYDGNFLVLNIPKSCAEQIFKLIRPQTIQIRDKIYLFLTEENICKAMQNMENVPRIDFCMQSRCQIYIFSQRLKILNQIFLFQLGECFVQKNRKRQQKLSRCKQQQYDLRCLSNQQYQKIIKAKTYNWRNRKYKTCRKQEESHQQISIIQRFYINLLQLCESFNLHNFILRLKNKILKKDSAILNWDNLNNLDISEISQHSKNGQQQINTEVFYEILFTNLWNIYDSFLKYQYNKFIEFEEQLDYSSFSQSYLSLLEYLATLLDPWYIKQINRLQVEVMSLQRIKKILSKQRNGVQFKNSGDLSNYKQKIVLNIIRSELVLKMFRLTKSWIFDFQQLFIQPGFHELKLSYKHIVALSYLVKINKL